MLTYYCFKELFKDYGGEISVEDFVLTLMSILALVFTLALDILLLIPESLYLGFKLIMRRFGK